MQGLKFKIPRLNRLVDVGHPLVEMKYKILDNVVYSFYGEDLEPFIDGLTTNRITEDKSAFLDKFARVIVVVDQVLANNVLYITFPAKFEERFEEHVKIFINFSKVKMVKENYKVLFVIHGVVNGIRISHKAGSIFLVENLNEYNSELTDLQWLEFRLENGIPLQGIEYDQNQFLELDMVDAVDYEKGCYLGQEIVARIKGRSKPARKLVRILVDKVPKEFCLKSEKIGEVLSSVYSSKYSKYITYSLLSKYDEPLEIGKILEK
jgi:folate-binding protein YgfZ